MEGGTVRMRGVVAWLVLAGIVILLSSGVALANNSINCSGGSCDGTAKNDTMHGTATPDDMNARRGDDRMYGLGSDDFLYGRQGADTLQAGIDDDALYGDFGNDKLRGGPGDDIINAHDEPPSKWRDVIDCGPGRDTVYFDKGFDKLRRNCEV